MSVEPQDPNRGKRVAGQVLVSLGAALAVLSGFGFFLSGPWNATDALSAFLGTAVIAGMPLIIGLVLLRKAGPQPPSISLPAGKLAPLSGIRIFFSVVGILIMVFAGGCTLLFLGSYFFETQGGQNYITPPVILIFGGPPFLVGLAIWLLALKAGRRRGS
jgi:hypothetical protein